VLTLSQLFSFLLNFLLQKCSELGMQKKQPQQLKTLEQSHFNAKLKLLAE
jgi:hypothetical protein